ENLNVIHNGIDIFPPPSEKDKIQIINKLGIINKKVILFVGRLDQRKGVIFLVKAIKELKNDIKEDFKCIIVGNGPIKNHILKYIKNNNLDSYFSFVNKVNYKNLRKIFFLCDVLVLPSLYEGLGLVLLEAMASKKPVIGTNSGGIPEIIKHGYNGFLTPLRSIKHISKAIKKILSNNELAKKMGEHGYTMIKRDFTWEKAVKKTLKIYKRLI
ncbi:MAG: glycosyltransferase family 4 protein, partial [Candidatus Helarchaeota archaeon]